MENERSMWISMDITQPEGTKIKLVGNPHDVHVLVETLGGIVPLHFFAHPTYKSSITYAYQEYASIEKNRTIRIPMAKDSQHYPLVASLAVLHECGHSHQQENPYCRKIHDEFVNLRAQLFAPDRTFIGTDELLLEAYRKGIQQYSNREWDASACAIFWLGRLRDRGLDVLPGYTDEKIVAMCNENFKNYELNRTPKAFHEDKKFRADFAFPRFNKRHITSLLRGYLPLRQLPEQPIREHTEKILSAMSS